MKHMNITTTTPIFAIIRQYCDEFLNTTDYNKYEIVYYNEQGNRYSLNDNDTMESLQFTEDIPLTITLKEE